MNELAQQLPALANNPILTGIIQHWLLALLILIAAFLLLFLVIIPLICKLFRHGKKVKETSVLKKDLMVWKNLASLVQGGDKGQAAKQALSGQLKLIHALFRQGLNMLKESHHKRYDLPWFILLGEPQSGKSTLLANSDQDLTCFAKEETDVTTGKRQTLPLRCWLGARAFVVDVAGRVFFDRWLNGSSSEWNTILRLLNRKHHKHPLDGILLAIPADALLSDDEVLTKQKASLIASEIQQLLTHTGQNLNCHVIITKTDMLFGFREYFKDLNDKAIHSVFGWQNTTQNGKFDSSIFQNYWTATLTKLQNGCGPQMLEHALFHTGNSTERLNTSGRLYLFPDSFNALHQNLNFYLSTIFGVESWRGNDQLHLGGVYFTSAEDQGIVLSSAFAALSGKPMEEALLQSAPLPKKKSCFIRDLLSEQIFGGVRTAFFTPREQFKRDIPGYLLCLLIACVGCIWFFSAQFTSKRIQKELQPLTHYYQGLGTLFNNNAFIQSPLIACDDKGQSLFLDNEEMKGTPNFTRLQFFYDARNKTNYPIYAPLGFKTASLLTFGWRSNLGDAYRQNIFDQIQTRMVYLPAVDTIEKRLSTITHEPFDLEKREALYQFATLIFTTYNNRKTPLNVKPFLNYLFPSHNEAIKRLLSDYDPENDWNSADIAAKIVYDYKYNQTQRTWVTQFLEAWKKLGIYENKFYPQVRNLIENEASFCDRQKTMTDLANQFTTALPENGKLLEAWEKACTEQLQISTVLASTTHTILKEHALSLSPTIALEEPEKAKTQELSSFTLNTQSLIQQGFDEYTKLLENDEQMLYKYIYKYNLLAEKTENLDLCQIENNAIKMAFAAIRKSLNAECQSLQSIGNTCQTYHLFSYPNGLQKEELKSNTDTSLLIYSLISAINTLNKSLSAPTPLTQPAAFMGAWTYQKEQYAKLLAQLDDFTKHYGKDKTLSAIITTSRQQLQCHYQYNCYLLVKELLTFYSDAEKDLAATIAAQSKHTPILDASSELLAQSIGPLNGTDCYDATAANVYLNSYAQFLNIVAEIEKQKLFSVTELFPNFKPISKTVDSYLDCYLNYWGNLPDSTLRVSQQWTEFQSLCTTLKPYQINILLSQLYKKSYDVLSTLPETILSDAQKTTRKAYLSVLNDRLQILTPHFSEICTQQMGAWSTLPKVATQAFLNLQGLSAKTRQCDYLEIIATDKKGDIPWWSNFFLNGVAVLKKDAGNEILNDLQNKAATMFRFPLCSDSLDKQPLSSNELQVIRDLIQRSGVTATTDTSSAVSPADDLVNLNLAKTLKETEVDLLTRFLTISTVLLDQLHPVVWTVNTPDATLRKKLTYALQSDLSDATLRFRYWELWCGNKQIGERHQTDIIDKQLLRGQIADADLEIRFFAFSNDETPAATLQFKGTWSILQLYLTKGATYDADAKCLYVPLSVKDNFDTPFIFWITLSFNQTLPLPKDWPSFEKRSECSTLTKEAQPTSENKSVTPLLLSE